MTIDERLDRLAERHEALAQTVELIAHENQVLQGTMRQTAQMIGTLAETVSKLVVVVQAHEHRLENLEGGA